MELDYSILQIRGLPNLNELELPNSVKNSEAISELLDLTEFLKLNTSLIDERFNEDRISEYDLKSILFQSVECRKVYETRFDSFYKLKVEMPGQDIWIKFDLSDSYYSIKITCEENGYKYSISTNSMNKDFIIKFPCKL